MGEGHCNLGEGHTGRDVSNGVEKGGPKKGEDERLRYFGPGLEVEGPEAEHP